MEKMSEKAVNLVNKFLTDYKHLIAEEISVPFHPRSLVMISQPDTSKADKFDFIAYNKWFDEIDGNCLTGTSHNMIEAFLDVPINVLITAEELGRPLLSAKDQKKLAKALRLIGELKVERQ